MNCIYLTAVILCVSCVTSKAALPPAQCLTGEFHKAKPGPETSNYKACHLYKSNTCCTASFTDQLSRSPIIKIGNFSWNTCGNFNKRCEEYMKEVECFYQCSPNVGYWKGQYKGSFEKVPLCAKFCDNWFDACRTDTTCAKNWITDFIKNKYGENSCNGTCKTFADVYGNGKQLCESMWGRSFVYHVSKVENDCMHLNSTDADVVSKNIKVAEKYKSLGSKGFSEKISIFLILLLGPVLLNLSM